MKKEYSAFNRFIFRTPLLDCERYNNDIFFNDNVFNESIFLASPDFYSEKIKEFKDVNITPKMK